MTLMTDTATTTAKNQPQIVGLRPIWTGPLANPRRIRLTAPGNPVHR